ncbi:protein tyrosine kinase [Paraburkholderia phytofirmans OLGA172]|uniref:Protein tyrosine kinase n=2 Tax=Paraburkholderia phytofirmans TaxID=261302 RepID=A0A160FS03_9BURK|nr:protein tyrosine kinase [Paraburkholderia phytofirmans OLGA172]
MSSPVLQLHETSSGVAEPSLSEYVLVVLHNWKTIIAIATVILAIGVSYAIFSTPVYQADALIQVEDPTSSAKEPFGDLAALFDTTATAAAETQLILSRLVIQKTVRQQHLDIDAVPNYFPLLGEFIARHATPGKLVAPWLGMRRFSWGGASIDVSQFELPYGTDFTLIAGRANGYQLLDHDNDVIAKCVVGTLCSGMLEGLPFTMQVDNFIANEGTRFSLKRSSELDTIARLQDELNVEEKTKQSGIISVTLDGKDSGKITQIVNGIGRNYVAQNVKRKRDEVQSTLDFLAKQLPALKAKLEASESAYNEFRNRKGTVDLSEESRLLLSQLVDSRAKQMELEQKRTELQQRFSDDHPAVAALTDNIAAFAAEQRNLGDRVQGLPNTEQEALRLLRDVRVDTQLYTNLLDTSQQLSVMEAGQVGNVRVVDWAMQPDKPVKPKKLIVVGISLILGLVLGVAVPFIRRALDVRIEHTDQIEQILSAPVYSVVPHSDRQPGIERLLRKGGIGKFLLAGVARNDVAIEALRSLQTALHLGAINAENNIILITGSSPESGKSFLSVNLAAVLAAGGKRVLLIDADLRRGNVHACFGKNVAPGLSDVMLGEAGDASIHREVLPRLDLLARGSKTAHPAEILMNGRLKALLGTLSTQYDAVIVDTPPVLAVTDAILIAPHAGTVLMAVRHGRQTASEIAEAARRIRNSDIVIRGAVLTDVPQGRFGYGGYGTGYYAYEGR